ncbi:SLC32A [Mytilus coruscus]|uniref:SLC32A n=1 Tax=Mytilus coruscus TaxID=42192 RepID=A0A6J8DTY2_MYTCO|nr:SLC32A [Mytilus coruscus]
MKRKNEKQRNEDHDFSRQRRQIQPTKKKNCGVKLRIRHVVRFPDYKSASLLLGIDDRLKEYIRKMVWEENITSVPQMRVLLEVYMKTTLFQGQDIPAIINKRFWPSNVDIQNHIALAVKKQRNKEIDQQSLEEELFYEGKKTSERRALTEAHQRQIKQDNMRPYLVTITLNIFNFGSSVVFLVLAAGNIETLLTDVIKDISFCYWLMILTCIVVPIVCLGTPKDFWPIGVGAAISTGIACTLIIIQIFQDNSHSKNTTVHSNIKLQKFSSAFGTMVFAVSGHSVFPTIITDMKKKEDFKLAALLGYGSNMNM